MPMIEKVAQTAPRSFLQRGRAILKCVARLHAITVILFCVATLQFMDAKMVLADQAVQLAATDDVPALQRKLQTALFGVAPDEVAAVLAASGARRISVVLADDPSEPAPVYAIFGLKRGMLRNDLRVMLLASLDTAQHLDQITSVEIFPK